MNRQRVQAAAQRKTGALENARPFVAALIAIANRNAELAVADFIQHAEGDLAERRAVGVVFEQEVAPAHVQQLFELGFGMRAMVHHVNGADQIERTGRKRKRAAGVNLGREINVRALLHFDGRDVGHQTARLHLVREPAIARTKVEGAVEWPDFAQQRRHLFPDAVTVKVDGRNGVTHDDGGVYAPQRATFMPYSCQCPESATPARACAGQSQSEAEHAGATSFAWFVLSGGVCFVVGTGLLYLATDVCKIHYLLSTLLCSLLTNALGFCLNRRLAFRARSAHFWRELGRYYIVNLGSLALSLTLMALCVSGLGWPYLGASIGLSLLLAVGNFFLHRNWSFGT